MSEEEITIEPMNYERVMPLDGPRYLTFNGGNFPWGPVDVIHEIGRYHIVEYRQDKSMFHSTSWDEHGATRFHPYVDGKDTLMSFLTLESAVVAAISYFREGPNGSAAYYFDRMTGVE